MTAPAVQQMQLGQVPVGWLATTNPDGTAPVYKVAAKSPAGVITGHPYGDDTAQFTVAEAHELAAMVFAMPDPAEPAAPATGTLTPDQVHSDYVREHGVEPAQAAAVAAVQQTFPQAQQVATIGTSNGPSAAPAQQVPETGQAAALSPLVRAAVALFDASTMPAVTGATELAEPFKAAAFAISRGPKGPRTIEALHLLLQARAMAALALFEPNF